MIEEGLRLAPWWRYYGGKYRAAPRYPKPEHNVIVEPFAGAAGYSTRYYWHRVILIEKYDVIYDMWRFLISASYDDVMDIPCVESIDDLPNNIPIGARHLVGFSFNDATVKPSNKLSAGRKKLTKMRLDGDPRGGQYEGWNEAKKERIARQVEHINHWEIYQGDYSIIPANLKATWFVDPPYDNRAGSHYIHSDINYKRLGRWCRSLYGQVIVCENEGADWLPFEPFYTFKAGVNGTGSKEVIWTR